MPSYKAPLRDMRFIAHEVWDFAHHVQQLPVFADMDQDLFDSILEEAAKICEEKLFPINQNGDAEGCHFENGVVTTPKGFKEAYKEFTEAGWTSLNSDPEYGGQGLSKVLQVMLDEMLCSSNVSFSLYTVLTQGACNALAQHASDEIKQKYLTKMVSGEWSGTMCLTEAHCGTDLGLLRTKAEPQEDGSYAITGTKIFITSGEHDLTDNIIHAVLARLPDASPGVKGISLFLVPKFHVNDDGSIGERNSVYCGSIEHKMGIKASSTCVMNFENAKGYLIGEANKGMKAMFTMMNLERLNIGLEGLGLSETSYQNALAYAKDRIQGRAPAGPLHPDKAADPLLVHPDVRRMLLTMKAYNEGARALALWVAMQIDIAKHHEDEEKRQRADNMVALLTPVIKAFFTDYGFEACNLGLQVLGGHGYVTEWGMEQYVRDSRIAQIYEGANGIQALDLVKRKLIMNDGQYLNELSEILSEFVTKHYEDKALCEFIQPLEQALKTLVDVSFAIIQDAENDPAAAGAASTDYLKVLGIVCLAFCWACMVEVAYRKQDEVGSDKAFYQSKLNTARFFFNRILPEIYSLQAKLEAGSECLMAMDAEGF